MTRNELKDIIKECLLDMKYSNNITLEDVVAEAAEFSYSYSNIIESYIEESNNFNNNILLAIDEAASKETVNRLKEKAKNAIKTIIEKIKKFITFIKEKVTGLIKKIKDKILKIKVSKYDSNLNIDKLKNKAKEIGKEDKLNEFLTQKINTYNIEELQSISADYFHKIDYNGERIIKGEKSEITSDEIKKYPGDKVFITCTINQFLLDKKSNLKYVELVQKGIEKYDEPLIEYLQEQVEDLNRKLKDIESNKLHIWDNKYDYSTKIGEINILISYYSMIISKTEECCEKYMDQSFKVKSKLFSLGLIDIG